MGVFLVTNPRDVATRVIKPADPHYSSYILTCGILEDDNSVIAITAGRIPKKLTTTINAGHVLRDWDGDFTMCASYNGHAIFTTKRDSRRESGRYKEAKGYLIFDSESIRGSANVCTLEGHEVKIFTARSKEGETVTTNRAIFCFYNDGDTLCVTDNQRERYFVYTDGEIKEMSEFEYEARFPEEYKNTDCWIDITK